MPKNKFKFVWTYREDDGSWQEDKKKEYSNTIELWEEICSTVIKKSWADDAALWLVSVADYPSYASSILNGMKEAIIKYTKQSNIGYKVVGRQHNGRAVEPNGKFEEKGYYLILYYQDTPCFEIYRSILEMLDLSINVETCKTETLDVTITRFLEIIENSHDLEEKVSFFLPIIEASIDDKINKIRNLSSTGKQDLGVKLRGLLLVSDNSFSDIKNILIKLPKQIKAVGRLQEVAQLKSNNIDKIIDNRDELEKNEEAEYEHESKDASLFYKTHVSEYSKQTSGYENKKNNENSLDERR